MANGVLIESQLMADTIGTLNKAAFNETIDFDGGNLVALTPPAYSSTVGTSATANSSQDSSLWQASVPSATTLGNLYMAYNPSDQLLESTNGNLYAGLTVDPRELTNNANRPFSVFKIKIDDQIKVNVDNIDSTASSIVVGDILEAKASQSTLTRIAEATGATAGVTAFKVISIDTLPYPQKNGVPAMDFTTVYRCICVQEA